MCPCGECDQFMSISQLERLLGSVGDQAVQQGSFDPPDCQREGRDGLTISK